MLRTSLVLAAVLAASPAFAQPTVQRAVAVDTQGWTLLGEQQVQGHHDRDTIVVGRYEGRFDQIQLVVLDSDIELGGMTVHFANGEQWSPTLKHSFREGQRSRAIDLPGNNRAISKIELRYANTAGGGRAKVAVYGRDKTARPPVPSPAPAGWTLLGEQKVQGRRDRDTIVIGRYEGKFDQLQLSVLDSDIALRELTVYFANGEQWSPVLKYLFKEGQRTRAIDLPGKDRVIAKVELRYENTLGGGAARVQLFGRDKTASSPPAPAPAPAPAFDPQGWTLLGEQTVNGRRDRDAIRVGKYAGQFDQLTMVVSDSDLELLDFTVVFPRGQRWSPQLKHTFRENSRTRVIDLPGKDRVINRIELRYANLLGGGRAKVQIYGRDAGRPTPPPPAPAPVSWDNKGWTLLGKTTVDGWRDRDRLPVTQPNPFTEVMFVVSGSDVELRNIVITLGNRERFEMPSAVVFKEGTRTAPIDIPGKLRKIRSIEFAYANLPGGGRASIEVWARKKLPPAPPADPTVRDHRR